MSITINFKTSQGLVTSRQFNLNQGVSIYGSFTGIVGEPEPFSNVHIQINDKDGNTIYYNNTSTNIFGDYNFYFVTPSTSMQLTVIVTGFYTVTGQDQLIIPIGIGETPDPVPVPVAPESPWNLLSFIPILLIGFVGYELYKLK